MAGLPPGAGESSQSLWPLAVYALLVVVLVGAAFGLSAALGPRHRARRRDLPYESGMPPTRQAPLRFPVHFYLVAIDFLIFDIEAAILFAWAGSARQVGWSGYIAALIFVVILMAGLAYVWGKGGLEWARGPVVEGASR